MPGHPRTRFAIWSSFWDLLVVAMLEPSLCVLTIVQLCARVPTIV